MAPRLSHTKTRNGCLRCKARKVKCDETRPNCKACQRHNVTCQYKQNYIHLRPSSGRRRNDLEISDESTSRRTKSLPRSSTAPHLESQTASTSPSVETQDTRLLELRLLHQYAAYTSLSFSAAGVELWCRLAPTLAFSHEFLLDTIFALAALHLSRLDSADKQFLQASRHYLRKSVEGHSRALSSLNGPSMAEALFLASQLLSFHSFVVTGTGEEATEEENLDPFRWLRVGSGGRIVFQACQPFLDRDRGVMRSVLNTPPNLLDGHVVFDPSNVGDLKGLLEWGTDFESISEVDKEAYDKTVSYIGLIYINAGESKEDPLASCRRVISMPARCPERFFELVEERRPRALAILAHHYAVLKVIKADLWWMKGIAERQVRIINDLLPHGWKPMIDLPMKLIAE